MLNLQFGTLCQVLNERGLARVSVLRENGEDLYQLHDAHLHGGSFEAVRNGDPVAFTLDETHQPRAGQYQRVAQAVLLSHDCFQEYESPPGTMRFSMKSAAEILAPQWLAERRAASGTGSGSTTATPASSLQRQSSAASGTSSDVAMEVPEYLTSRARNTPDTTSPPFTSPREPSPRDLFNAVARDSFLSPRDALTPRENSARAAAIDARGPRFALPNRASSGPELVPMPNDGLEWARAKRDSTAADAAAALAAVRRGRSAGEFELPTMGPITRSPRLGGALEEETCEDESFHKLHPEGPNESAMSFASASAHQAAAAAAAAAAVAALVGGDFPEVKLEDDQESDASSHQSQPGAVKHSRLPLAAPKKDSPDDKATHWRPDKLDTSDPGEDPLHLRRETDDAMRRALEESAPGVASVAAAPLPAPAPAPVLPITLPPVPQLPISRGRVDTPPVRRRTSAAALAATIESLPLECPLCTEIFLDPITLPTCGHSFCQLCLRQVEARTSSAPVCPSCRKTAGSFKTLSISVVLRDVCERLHPRELAQRRAEVAGGVEHSPHDNIPHPFAHKAAPARSTTHHAHSRPPLTRHHTTHSTQPAAGTGERRAAALPSSNSVLEFAQAVFNNSARSAAAAQTARARFDDPATADLAAMFEQHLRLERQHRESGTGHPREPSALREPPRDRHASPPAPDLQGDIW